MGRLFRVGVPDESVMQSGECLALARLERTARGLGNRCSIHLSYRALYRHSRMAGCARTQGVPKK